MARKDIYFFIQNNEALAGFVGDAASSLHCLGGRIVIEKQTAPFIRKLKSRKTRPTIIILLSDDLAGILEEICDSDQEIARPHKIVFVNSTYSSIDPGKREAYADKLEKVGVQPIVSDLTNVTSSKVLEQWL